MSWKTPPAPLDPIPVEKTVENVENLVESVETIDFTMKFAVDMPQDSVFFGEFSTGILDKGKNKP